MPAKLPLGKVLRELRQTGGLSQGKFSELVGIERSNISLMETGDRTVTIEALVQISNATKVPAWKILRKAEKQMLQMCNILGK